MSDIAMMFVFGVIVGMGLGMFIVDSVWKEEIKRKSRSLIDIYISGKFYKVRLNEKDVRNKESK